MHFGFHWFQVLALLRMPSNKNDLLSKKMHHRAHRMLHHYITDKIPFRKNRYHSQTDDLHQRRLQQDTREYPIGRNKKSESENAWCRKPGGNLPEVWAWDSQEEDHPAIWERKRGEKHKPTSFSPKPEMNNPGLA